MSKSEDNIQGSEQLDPSDTLTGDDTEDALDDGYEPPTSEPSATRFGMTAEEERAGESLDQRLSEEEPEIS
jgi:hypothetical protein